MHIASNFPLVSDQGFARNTFYHAGENKSWEGIRTTYCCNVTLLAGVQMEVHNGQSTHQLAPPAECAGHSQQVQCSFRQAAELAASRAVYSCHCLHHPAQLLPPHHAGHLLRLPHVPLPAALQVTFAVFCESCCQDCSADFGADLSVVWLSQVAYNP